MAIIAGDTPSAAQQVQGNAKPARGNGAASDRAAFLRALSARNSEGQQRSQNGTDAKTRTNERGAPGTSGERGQANRRSPPAGNGTDAANRADAKAPPDAGGQAHGPIGGELAARPGGASQAITTAGSARSQPPAEPEAPGYKPIRAESGPNDFRIGVKGPDPNLAVGGNRAQQQHQRDLTVALSTQALPSYVTGHTPVPRSPGDARVSGILDQLSRNSPIGKDGREVTNAVYQSEIPNATPKQAYRHFVNNPDQVFNAGGMEIRPPADGRLQDGGRYMLEIGGPAPTWLPVETTLDPRNNAVTINTLDGHVLRGEQTFTFTGNGNGGTTLTQDARFQASSRLPGELQELSSIADGQHSAWQNAHREIYEQFNGDRGYAGLGTSAFNAQQTGAWAEALDNVVNDPAAAADTGIDTAGVLSNWGIDGGGRAVGDALDTLGAPGGEAVREGADTAGDWTEGALDTAGDWVERGGEAVGEQTARVTPWDGAAPW